MDISEGALRMQKAGRAMLVVALSAFAFCAVAAAIYAFLPASLHVTEVFSIVVPLMVMVVWICSVAILVGGVLWAAGWILEGFFHRGQ